MVFLLYEIDSQLMMYSTRHLLIVRNRKSGTPAGFVFGRECVRFDINFNTTPAESLIFLHQIIDRPPVHYIQHRALNRPTGKLVHRRRVFICIYLYILRMGACYIYELQPNDSRINSLFFFPCKSHPAFLVSRFLTQVSCSVPGKYWGVWTYP